jgi:hypothetical protein
MAKSAAITSVKLPKAQTVMSVAVNIVVPLPLAAKTAAFMGLVVWGDLEVQLQRHASVRV